MHLVYFAPSDASFRSERRSVPAFHTLSPPTDIPEGATERPAFHTSNPPKFPREPSGLKSLRLTPLSTAAFASHGGSSRRGQQIPLPARKKRSELSAFSASVKSSEPSALRLSLPAYMLSPWQNIPKGYNRASPAQTKERGPDLPARPT